MLKIAERLNATRKSVKQALLKRDAAFIRHEARAQTDAGADWLDLNSAAEPDLEAELMPWLIETVQAEVSTPLCIDSADPKVIEIGLKLHKNGQPLVNSITMETGRHETVLPLVKEYHASVIGLALDDSGIGKTAADRLKAVERLVEALAKHGIPLSELYVDPLVLTVSSDPHAGRIALEVVREVKVHWPEAKIAAGLSNISFGLPRRGLLNRVYLTMMLAAGADAAIVDPLDQKQMAAVLAAETLLGRDAYCLNYLTAFRAGKLD